MLRARHIEIGRANRIGVRDRLSFAAVLCPALVSVGGPLAWGSVSDANLARVAWTGSIRTVLGRSIFTGAMD